MIHPPTHVTTNINVCSSTPSRCHCVLTTCDKGWSASLPATVIPHLAMDPLLEWVGSNSPYSSIMDPVRSGEAFSRTLVFSPLRTSHGGQYSCRATINITDIPAVVSVETVNVTVQSKSVVSMG